MLKFGSLYMGTKFLGFFARTTLVDIHAKKHPIQVLLKLNLAQLLRRRSCLSKQAHE